MAPGARWRHLGSRLAGGAPAAILAASAAALLACGGAAGSSATPGPATDRGSARIVVSGALGAAVQRVAVRIVADAPGAAPVERDLAAASGQYTADVADLAVGTYTVTATAYAADGTALFRAEASVAIGARQVTAVALVLQQVAPPPPATNVAPHVTSLVASDAAPYYGETITLAVTAADPDPGAALSYAWEASCGGAATSLTAAASATTDLAAACSGELTVTVHVSDELGATSTASLVLHYATQGLAATVSLNAWPAVTGIASRDGQVAAGADVALAAAAADDDGDPLAYAWASDCGGTFTNGDSAAATFHTPPVAPAGGRCKLTVTVSDGRGGTGSGDLTVWVE
jgi:hypothetical protein